MGSNSERRARLREVIEALVSAVAGVKVRGVGSTVPRVPYENRATRRSANEHISSIDGA